VGIAGSPRPGLPVGSVQGPWVGVACMPWLGGGGLVPVCDAREGVKNRRKMTKTRKVVKNTFSGGVPRGRPPGLKTHTHRGHTTPTTDFGFGAVGTPGANGAPESRFPTHFGPDRHLPPQGQSGRVRQGVLGYARLTPAPSLPLPSTRSKSLEPRVVLPFMWQPGSHITLRTFH